VYIQSKEDYIERLIRNFTRAVACILVGRSSVLESIELEDIQEESAISGREILMMMLNKYITEKDFCRAENLLWEEVIRNPSPENFQVAEMFYEALMLFDEKTLQDNNFSIGEIVEGRRWMQQICGQKE